VLVVFSRYRSVRASLWIAGTAAAMPLLWIGPVLLVTLLVSPLVPYAILGHADGEDWSEGFVALGTVGVWSLLWSAVLIVIVGTRTAWRSEAETCDVETSGMA